MVQKVALMATNCRIQQHCILLRQHLFNKIFLCRQGFDSHILRYSARLLLDGKIDAKRKFVITYFLSDDTILVTLVPEQNSGNTDFILYMRHNSLIFFCKNFIFWDLPIIETFFYVGIRWPLLDIYFFTQSYNLYYDNDNRWCNIHFFLLTMSILGQALTL